ncbi:MAG: sporulation protein YlmC with PRC-barrel domain [Limisphaerales bacterium]|jgi:sporulation protein YlmC with PRC-barrel domain
MKYWLIGILSFLGVNATADVTRASLFVDRVVLTSGGELLGRVEDLALDEGSMQVAYVVVSVGSYLIDDNLIAVTPETLTESESGEYLVIAADALVDAPRFDADSWPDEAQIDVPVVRDERLPPAMNDPGIAEIVGGDRRMTLDETGQTAMTQFEKTSPRPAAVSNIQAKTFHSGVVESGDGNATFKRFDSNRDGYLSRREIASYFKPGLLFGDYDLDANGGLDPFEMKVLQEAE